MIEQDPQPTYSGASIIEIGVTRSGHAVFTVETLAQSQELAEGVAKVYAAMKKMPLNAAHKPLTYFLATEESITNRKYREVKSIIREHTDVQSYFFQSPPIRRDLPYFHTLFEDKRVPQEVLKEKSDELILKKD